jgi:hypothetical protein
MARRLFVRRDIWSGRQQVGRTKASLLPAISPSTLIQAEMDAHHHRQPALVEW